MFRLISLLSSIAALSLTVSAAAVPDKVVDRFTPAPYQQQKLSGYLAARMQVNLEHRLLQIEEDALLAGFRKRPGSHPWIGEHIGKYLDAAANTLEYTQDERLKTQMTRMAKALIQTQLPDGYLGTYTDDQRWTSWDVWSHKYNLIGLLAYYRVSGDPAALAAARRIGDLLHKSFGEGKLDIIAASTHAGMAATSVLEPMCQLYRQTGEPRYLEFALYITRAWEQPNGPKLISSLTTHGNVARTANGKAYEMMSDLVGLIELHRITGEPSFLLAARNAQADIAKNRRYLTGTTSAHEHFHGDGILPGDQPHDVGEGCATVTWLQLNWQLLRLTGEARYANELERTVFNQLLAAQNPANGNICYFTPMNGRKITSDGINCCRSSEPRGISMIPALVWGKLPDGIAIEQYAPGKATIGEVEIRSETDFPASGAVRLILTPAKPGSFTLYLRVPEWTAGFAATTGGRKYKGKPGEYLVLPRTWGKDQVVDIRMDMTVRAHDGGISYPDSLAYQRGPQVLAVDRSVNPAIPYLFRTGLRSDKMDDGVYFDGTQRIVTSLQFVPFADAKEYRIWLYKPGKLPATPVPVSYCSRESFSARDKLNTGALTDELLNDYVGLKSGKEVWWAIELPKPATVRRVAVAAGEIAERGGWLDTAGGKPQVQIQRIPKGPWETVATLDSYPATTPAAAPSIRPGQWFEVTLRDPVQAVAIRLLGKAAREFASLAELAAY